MRYLFTLTVCFSLLSAGVSLGADDAAADAARGRELFEELFGQQYRKALSTREIDDDLALARRMLMTAPELANEPALIEELCDRVYMLGVRSPAGATMAVEAMRLLAEHRPAQAEAARGKIEQVLRRALLRADGEQKSAAAAALVDFLIELGDLSHAAGDFGGAARQYQQALRIAETEKDARVEELRAKADAAMAREKIEQRITAAMNRLGTDPNDRVANTELWHIYFIELDRPAQAQRFAKHAGDEAAKLTEPAAKAIDELNAATAVTLGAWHQTLAESAEVAHQVRLKERARAFYEQALLDANIDKLDRVKANLAIARLREQWLEANPEAAKLIALPAEDGWIDLLANVEPARHGRGLWKRAGEGGGVTIKSDDFPARLTLPAVPPDSYDLSVRFTRSAGDGPVVLLLPVRGRTAKLVLNGWEGKASGLYALPGDKPVSESEAANGDGANDGAANNGAANDGGALVPPGNAAPPVGPAGVPDQPAAPPAFIRNATTVTPGAIALGQPIDLAVRVLSPAEDRASITVKLNGSDYITWQGDPSQFQPQPEWALHAPAALGVGARNGAVTFSSAKLQPLRGDATKLTPPATLAERGAISPADGPVDLLTLFDPEKDHTAGDWKKQDDGSFVYTYARRGAGRAALPVTVPVNAGYKLRITFRQSLTTRARVIDGGPALHLPVGGGRVSLVTGEGRAGAAAGLNMINAAPFTTNGTAAQHEPFSNDQPHVLEAIVAPHVAGASIVVTLDDKPLISWQGDPSTLTAPPAFAMPDPRQPGVATNFGPFVTDGTLTIDRATIQATHASLPLARSGSAVAEHDPTPVDIIKLTDPRKHTVSGRWSTAGDRLTTELRTLDGQADITLPVAPRGEYELSMKFARTLGRGIVTLAAPTPDGAATANIVLGADEGRISTINVPGGRALAASRAVRLGGGVLYDVKLTVKKDKDDGETVIEVDFEGKPFLRWKGPVEQLGGRRAAVGPTPFSLSVYNPVARSTITVTHLQVRMLSGSPVKLK